MKNYILTEDAYSDLSEIWDYLSAHNVRAAIKMEDEILESCALLATHPHIGHVREELTEKPVKFWPVYNYLIIYTPKSSPLQILRILSGYRDLAVTLA